MAELSGIYLRLGIIINEELTDTEKIVLAEIHSVTKFYGEFALGHKWLAKFFGKTSEEVILVMKSLKEKGFITASNHKRKATINGVEEYRMVTVVLLTDKIDYEYTANLSTILNRGEKENEQ